MRDTTTYVALVHRIVAQRTPLRLIGRHSSKHARPCR
jgi:hypothetical protein